MAACQPDMGRFLSPDPAGMQAVDLEFPQSLNRYAYVWNNPLSFTDPTGLDCAYLNNAGNGLESFDQSSSSGECGRTGGYWVNGGLTDFSVNADQGQVNLTGTTNGDDQTHASYQDTTVNVGEYWNAGPSFLTQPSVLLVSRRWGYIRSASQTF